METYTHIFLRYVQQNNKRIEYETKKSHKYQISEAHKIHLNLFKFQSKSEGLSYIYPSWDEFDSTSWV